MIPAVANAMVMPNMPATWSQKAQRPAEVSRESSARPVSPGSAYVIMPSTIIT